MNYKFIPDSIEIDYSIQKVPANITTCNDRAAEKFLTLYAFSTQQMPRILPDITADRLASHSH